MHAVKKVETACRNLALVPFYCGLLKKKQSQVQQTKKVKFSFSFSFDKLEFILFWNERRRGQTTL